MESRDKAIEFTKAILQEDIIDQFHINEVDAALEGNTIFTVRNKIGEETTLQNIFQEESEQLIYGFLSSRLLMTRYKGDRRRICHHPTIEKGLHEKRFTCRRCGLIGNKEFFRRERER